MSSSNIRSNNRVKNHANCLVTVLSHCVAAYITGYYASEHNHLLSIRMPVV